MSRVLRLLLVANLLGLGALVFMFPNLMVGPGRLIPGHQQLETDCFACHQPWQGSSAARCAACHLPEQIGRVTTAGAPIVRAKGGVPFHQELVEQNCIACHSDHAGVRRFRSQGRFDHTLLQAATRDKCQTCHQAPKDSLHQKIDGNCTSCHQQSRWVPASFDHDRQFVLDRDHNTRCVTCHLRNDYSRYTCYGCHEHSQAKIRSEHIEEGIRDFANCVECHRSGDKHDIRDGREAGRAENGHSEGRRGEHRQKEKRHGRERHDD